MNNDEIYDLEIQMAFARNIFPASMVFEGGTGLTIAISGESFTSCQLEVIDHFFVEAETSFVDWGTTSTGTQ